MRIRVGLTTNDLTKLTHRSVRLSSPDGLAIGVQNDNHVVNLAAGQPLTVTVKNGMLKFTPELAGLPEGPVEIKSHGAHQIAVDSLRRQHGSGNPAPHYIGTIEVRPDGEFLRIILNSQLEDYVKGVLQSEIPASYHLQAVKAQAVAARTYALRPRINHSKDECNVCDSFLCCQYFAGVETISPRHAEAIRQTAGEILTWQGAPILALFSSNAGSCTEDYENCFSDPVTNAFPPPPRPYLKSASEKQFSVNSQIITEEDLRAIWHDTSFHSADSWSPQFRWHVVMPASAIEAHMHHEIDILRNDPAMAPFIVPPASGKFGHVKSFQIIKRGKSGTAIELAVETSGGNWTIRKELVIRSLFKNSEMKLARLKSAKLFFDYKKDNLGLLSQVTVSGLGWGHGVGMQQTGAQGWALQGKDYKAILAHYFQQSTISHA